MDNNFSISKIFRSLIPPLVNDYITSKKWRFEGSYGNFKEASEKCKGYSDRDTVLEMKKKFLEGMQPGNGKEVFLDPYDQQLLTSFLISLKSIDKEDVRILDIGGGFGSHYFKISKAIKSKTNFCWDIVETTTLIKEAKKINLNNSVNFYDDIDLLKNNKYDIILTSGTLQYLPDPEEMFLKLKDIKHSRLIINRFPLFDEEDDRLTIQSVPKSYYSASFPSWFFSNNKWIRIFEKHYNINFRWYCMSEVYLGMMKVPFQGFLLEKK
jgi:putative methyltransferase (TIGR04325 family)